MKVIKFLTITILIFSFQQLTKADDIRDFEIEGISVGDSLLNFYSKKEIKNFFNYDDLPSDMKFRIADDRRKKDNYDGLQFFYKPKDKKFDIYSVSGNIFCDTKIECNKIFEQIRSDMEKSMSKKFEKISHKHSDDKSGKSISTIYYLDINGGNIMVEYIDWSKEMKWSDNVNVTISTNEAIEWMQSDYGAG